MIMFPSNKIILSDKIDEIANDQVKIKSEIQNYHFLEM